MPRTRPAGGQPDEWTHPLSVVRERIQEQIHAGRGLDGSETATNEQFQKAHRAYQDWDKYNWELLCALFTTTKLAREYRSMIDRFDMGEGWRWESRGFLKQRLGQRVHNLEAILQRADLYSAPEESEIQPLPTSDILFHPDVEASSRQLFDDGHYRQAVLDAFIGLNARVKAKSGKTDLDGKGLMNTVFSPNNPILRVSSDGDEQQGFMLLFAGAMLGLRNPKAHSLEPTTREKAVEWLTFASALSRILHSSEVVRRNP